MWFTSETGSYTLRKPTDDEKSRITEAKQVANDAIRARRQRLQRGIKLCERSGAFTEARALEKRLNNLKRVTGLPVLVTVNGAAVCVDYEMLQTIERTLKRFPVRKLTASPGALAIDYAAGDHRGTLKLNQLQAYQDGLLRDLPTIEVMRA